MPGQSSPDPDPESQRTANGFDTETVRELLMAAFSDEELTTFCYDNFRSVHTQFAGGMTHTNKVQLLLEYCVGHGKVGRLLDLVKEKNQYQYSCFEAQLPSSPLHDPTPVQQPSTPEPPVGFQQPRRRLSCTLVISLAMTAFAVLLVSGIAVRSMMTLFPGSSFSQTVGVFLHIVPVQTPTPTWDPTAPPSAMPSASPSPSLTWTPTPSPPSTSTWTPTALPTPTWTPTASVTPTATPDCRGVMMPSSFELDIPPEPKQKVESRNGEIVLKAGTLTGLKALSGRPILMNIHLPTGCRCRWDASINDENSYKSVDRQGNECGFWFELPKQTQYVFLRFSLSNQNVGFITIRSDQEGGTP